MQSSTPWTLFWDKSNPIKAGSTCKANNASSTSWIKNPSITNFPARESEEKHNYDLVYVRSTCDERSTAQGIPGRTGPADCRVREIWTALNSTSARSRSGPGLLGGAPLMSNSVGLKSLSNIASPSRTASACQRYRSGPTESGVRGEAELDPVPLEAVHAHARGSGLGLGAETHMLT